MKRSSSKLPIFVLALSLATILLALPSCKCLDPTISTSTTTSATSTASTTSTTIDSATVHTRDSIIYRERTIHDTVYITKEVYRNHQISNVNSQRSTTMDTVVLTEWRERVIQHPPERYIPRFHKTCTTLFCLLLIGCIIYFFVKFCLF